MVNYDLIRQLIMMRMFNGSDPIYETGARQDAPCGWEYEGVGISCRPGSRGGVHVAFLVNGVEVESQSVDFKSDECQSVVVQTLARVITNVHLLIAVKWGCGGKEGSDGKDVR
jgi:hypothetical protein